MVKMVQVEVLLVVAVEHQQMYIQQKKSRLELGSTERRFTEVL